MPASGDQHKPNGAATANPFEETKPHISEYTAQEIATLQSRLNKRLGPEYISTRPGPGNQKIAYLSAEKAINLANEIFGFNGWSSSIQNIQIDFVDENAQSGKVSIGLSVVIRITLRDGTYHEDIGYGGIENCKGKAMAFEKSKKEATTDALKRALRNFGNVLGNCIYDKDFVTKVSKVKVGSGKFDVNELHRHSDFVPKAIENTSINAPAAQNTSKPPSLEFEDSFDVSEFDDIDFNENDLSHPDEVVIPAESNTRGRFQDTRPGPSNVQTPSKPPQTRPSAPQMAGQAPLPGQNLNGIRRSFTDPVPPANLPSKRPFQGVVVDSARGGDNRSSSPSVPSEHFANQQSLPPGSNMAPTAGFYSAKAASNIDPNNISAVPPNAAKFNPHAESPSIRKTAGVDHTKSVPVRRDLQKADTPVPPNVVNPQGDTNRRIGMPGQPTPASVGRPGMSTSAYRPPTRHGSPAVPNINANLAAPPNNADRALTAARRPPLVDVSNMQNNVAAVAVDGVEVKRQKVNSLSKEQGPQAPDKMP